MKYLSFDIECADGGKATICSFGYVVADESTRTNLDGVFAVGDVRTKALRQVVTAVGDGAVAVHFAEEYLASKRDEVTEKKVGK